MRVVKAPPLPTLFFLLMIACMGTQVKMSFAQELLPEFSAAIEPGRKGHINWTSGNLSAEGFGAPPPSAPPAAMETMATRAATGVARRNLLELVEGVTIDSETIVENFMVKSDVITSHVHGIIKHAFVTEKRVLPDGNVEVVLTMNLWGHGSLMSNLIQKTSQSSPSHSQADSYTGIIIDARDLDVQPATFPSITDDTGAFFYGKETVSMDRLRQMGIVQYVIPAIRTSAMQSAPFMRSVSDKPPTPNPQKRVGPRPLRLQGVRKTGALGTDIMISAADAEKVRRTPALMDLLRQANVIIVIDPLVAGVEGRLWPHHTIPVNFSFMPTHSARVFSPLLSVPSPYDVPPIFALNRDMFNRPPNRSYHSTFSSPHTLPMGDSSAPQ